jgi:hypothetical protein
MFKRFIHRNVSIGDPKHQVLDLIRVGHQRLVLSQLVGLAAHLCERDKKGNSVKRCLNLKELSRCDDDDTVLVSALLHD